LLVDIDESGVFEPEIRIPHTENSVGVGENSVGVGSFKITILKTGFFGAGKIETSSRSPGC
jgi:hypothetical protein